MPFRAIANTPFQVRSNTKNSGGNTLTFYKVEVKLQKNLIFGNILLTFPKEIGCKCLPQFLWVLQHCLCTVANEKLVIDRQIVHTMVQIGISVGNYYLNQS